MKKLMWYVFAVTFCWGVIMVLGYYDNIIAQADYENEQAAIVDKFYK